VTIPTCRRQDPRYHVSQHSGTVQVVGCDGLGPLQCCFGQTWENSPTTAHFLILSLQHGTPAYAYHPRYKQAGSIFEGTKMRLKIDQN